MEIPTVWKRTRADCNTAEHLFSDLLSRIFVIKESRGGGGTVEMKKQFPQPTRLRPQYSSGVEYPERKM